MLTREIETALKRAKSVQASWAPIEGVESRTWTSKGGGFTFDGTPIALADKEIRLKGASGKVVSVKIKSLSDEDVRWIESNLRK